MEIALQSAQLHYSHATAGRAFDGLVDPFFSQLSVNWFHAETVSVVDAGQAARSSQQPGTVSCLLFRGRRARDVMWCLPWTREEDAAGADGFS